MRYVLLALLLCSSVKAADDLPNLVRVAIAQEVEAFDDLESRWKKKKLKPGESAMLFGKKTIKPKEQIERMQALREQVGRGDVSFRMLNLDRDLKLGQVGVLAPQFQRITCSDAIEEGAFFGRYETGQADIKGRPTRSREFYFVGIPGTETIVPGKDVSISVPLIVTGRQVETIKLTPLAVLLKQIAKDK
ncbi:MAG: hypothetical protein ACKV2Q_10335 [Planctomycetaceae bacterium]